MLRRRWECSADRWVEVPILKLENESRSRKNSSLGVCNLTAPLLEKVSKLPVNHSPKLPIFPARRGLDSARVVGQLRLSPVATLQLNRSLTVSYRGPRALDLA